MKKIVFCLGDACIGAMARICTKMTRVSIVVAVSLAFVAGCGDADRHGTSAEKIAALEKDVARLRNEVRELRHRIEVDAKARSRSATPLLPHRSVQPDRGAPEDLRNGKLPLPRPVMREDPAKMTPEQRRAWHEERRRMREERKRERMSDSEKQLQTNQINGENK